MIELLNKVGIIRKEKYYNLFFEYSGYIDTVDISIEKDGKLYYQEFVVQMSDEEMLKKLDNYILNPNNTKKDDLDILLKHLIVLNKLGEHEVVFQYRSQLESFNLVINDSNLGFIKENNLEKIKEIMGGI